MLTYKCFFFFYISFTTKRQASQILTPGKSYESQGLSLLLWHHIFTQFCIPLFPYSSQSLISMHTYPTQLCIHICEAYPNIQTQPLPPITISLIKDKLGGHVTCQLIAYTLTPNSNLHFRDPECVIWYIIIYLWKIISWFITPDCDHLGKAHTRIKCWQFRQTMDVIKLVSVICIISTFRQYKSYDVHIYMYMSW